MAEKTQITSASSSIQTRPLGKNWTRGLKGWLNGLLADLKSSEVQGGAGTTVSQLPGSGRHVNVSTVGTETVTGAVNGVPATLNVQTDGAGWAGI